MQHAWPSAVSTSTSLGRHFLLQKARDYHSHRTHSWDSAGNTAAVTEFIIAVKLENEHLAPTRNVSLLTPDINGNSKTTCHEFSPRYECAGHSNGTLPLLGVLLASEGMQLSRAKEGPDSSRLQASRPSATCRNRAVRPTAPRGFWLPVRLLNEPVGASHAPRQPVPRTCPCLPPSLTSS